MQQVKLPLDYQQTLLAKKEKRFNNPKGVISLEPYKQLREIKREDVFILEGAYRQHWYVPFQSL